MRKHSILLFALIASPAVAQDQAVNENAPVVSEKSTADRRTVASAVTQVDRLMRDWASLDNKAIAESRVLEGAFNLALVAPGRDPQADGSLRLTGTLNLELPMDWFRLIQDQQSLNAAEAAVKQATKDSAEGVKVFKNAYKRVMKHNPINDFRWVNIAAPRNRKLWHTDESFRDLIAEKEASGQQRIAEAKAALDDLRQRIQHRIALKRAEASSVQLEVLVSPELVAATPQLLIARKLQLVVGIDDFQAVPARREPGEVIHIASLRLTAREIRVAPRDAVVGNEG